MQATDFSFQTIGILGAGVMGAQIAAHFANCGYTVYLYDLASDNGHDVNDIVNQARLRLQKLKPAPLANDSVFSRIIPANYQTDLATLSTCDFVLEAVAENSN